MWRAKYDMPPQVFAKELDRLWDQLRPLYTSLHAYVRSRLRDKYGDIVPANGPIPAHLLGNLWEQDWSNIYALVAPKDDRNKAWWDLTLKYQNVAPPHPRGEEFFDPGAKHHVPANTPYSRYFLAAVLQFQFHRALAKTACCTGPLHRCSIYESKAAGGRLEAMLEMGASRAWPDALEAISGQRQMDASAMAECFAPLKAWLDQQNAQK